MSIFRHRQTGPTPIPPTPEPTPTSTYVTIEQLEEFRTWVGNQFEQLHNEMRHLSQGQKLGYTKLSDLYITAQSMASTVDQIDRTTASLVAMPKSKSKKQGPTVIDADAEPKKQFKGSPFNPPTPIPPASSQSV